MAGTGGQSAAQTTLPYVISTGNSGDISNSSVSKAYLINPGDYPI